MANWNLPTVDSNYITFVDEVKNRDTDAALMFDGTGTNLPNLTIRWNQSNNRFERLEGGTWQGRTIGITGGGTGATTAAGARSNLNLGSMATQNSNAVGVTGGSITGVSFSGTGTLSGNASTASTWQTARTLQIGATGKSVNGSANVTWSAAEIGTSSNTGNTVVTRNASGNFSAGTITATFSGNGSAVTALNASNLTSGTVNAARLPSNVPLQQQQVVTLGNHFQGTDNLLCTRTGNIITLQLNGISELFTSMLSGASSAAGRVPPLYRPPTQVNNVYHVDGNSNVWMVTVTSSGTLSVSPRSLVDGSSVSRAGTNFFSITFAVQ